MSDLLEIFGFETSNNMKVRAACGFKGIPFRWRPIDPSDRSEIVALTGQPLTPVVRHRGATLFDSGAIVRYLEANFRETPPLFDADRTVVRAIEDWEAFGRHALLAPLISVAMMRFAGDDDPAVVERAAADFADGVGKLDAGLAGREWLVAGRMTAAEIFTAPMIHRVRASGILPLPDGLDPLLRWVDRVMAHDPGEGDAENST